MKNNYLSLTILLFGFIGCESNNNKSTISKKIDSSPHHAIASNVAKADTLNKKNKHFDGYPEKYQLKNDSLNILLTINKADSRHSRFQLIISINNNIQNINGLGELILTEDSNGSMIVPEGTAILDKATQIEYFCDSTFMYMSKNINISFARETKTRKRLSLLLYNSKMPGIVNNDYTLYNKISHD